MSLGAIDIDTRSDVYSLGILLYELLVGVLPFEADNAQPLAIVELRRAIREQEPTRPSARISRLGERISIIARARGIDATELRKQLRGDLDWIVLKALEKERDRRYASPHELSLDIDRYLHHEPLQARPPTTAYRMRKFVRRHRVGTAFAVVLALLIVSFVVVTIVQAQRIAKERDRATAEANKANSINAFLQETLGSADPWQTGKDVSIREVLANAVKKADVELKDQPLIAAAVKSTIGNAYTGLGQFDDAERLLEQSLDVRKKLLESPHVDIADSFEMLAELHRSKSDYAQSSRFAGEALGIYRALHGEEHELTARAMVLLAEQLDLQSKYEDAERIGTRALALLERRFGTASVELLEALRVVGSIASELGNFSRSEQLLTRAIDISQRTYGAQDLRTSLRINELAVLNFRSNKTQEAARLYADVVRIQNETLGPDHPTTLIAKENLAGALVALRRFDEALGLLNEVLAGRKAKLGEQAPPVVRTLANLANLQVEMGHYDESIALYELALPLFAAAYGIEHADNAFLQSCLGRVLRLDGQAKRAETVLRAELSRQPSRMAGNDLYRALAQYELGMALLDLRAYEEAESNLLAAYRVRLDRYGATNVRTRAAADALAKLYTAVGNPDKAAAFTQSEAARRTTEAAHRTP